MKLASSSSVPAPILSSSETTTGPVSSSSAVKSTPVISSGFDSGRLAFNWASMAKSNSLGAGGSWMADPTKSVSWSTPGISAIMLSVSWGSEANNTGSSGSSKSQAKRSLFRLRNCRRSLVRFCLLCFPSSTTRRITRSGIGKGVMVRLLTTFFVLRS